MSSVLDLREISLAFSLVALVFSGATAWSVPPDTINIHGMLVDGSGNPLSGTRAYVVRFYDAETGGVQLGNTLNGFLQVSPEGLFNLPAVLPPEALAAPQLWYELGIDTDTPTDGNAEEDIFPDRIRIHSVPFAVEAATVTQLDADRIGDGTVDNATFGRLAGVTQPVQEALDQKASGTDLAAHVSDDQNPHGVTAAQVGLGSVDNTADLDKPVSTAMQTALDDKADADHDHDNNLWQLGGNAATSPVTDFLGTTDDVPLEMRVNNRRALRIEPHAACPNLIGGFSDNMVLPDVQGATISGGGGVKGFNLVTDNYGAIGGGHNNRAGDNGADPTSAVYATVGGGGNNTAGARNSTVVGGRNNAAVGFSSTVCGGYNNSAQGHYSFAAGRQAEANHDGAFVWGDSSPDDVVASSSANQFTARTGGGARFFTNSDLTAGVRLAAGGGSWSSISDRNVKENFEPVDGVEVLEKVAAMPISTWNYTSQDAAIRHIGPMAQDVYAAFGVGESDTGITAIDADGIALAAIQGLNQRLEEKEEEIAALRADKGREIGALREEMAAMKKMIETLLDR